VSKEYATIQHRGSLVTLEFETTDPDVLPFVGVAASGEISKFTADELRELAEKMDKWQNMNYPGENLGGA
jgi:hypothetical protein